ncbi:hypothetical protein [Nocardioides soli]|uniref:Uncharacterized protein n=1 Tax=Nocardioides soli TaxID=1036020 RepID=A0A7W4VU98_9ACTN|nr:hypothetical protein [Nocardioides soli]MBB3041442.1 hypothetical protein [Nocardioides soli]
MTRRESRREWRSLTADEKQRRLDRLRRAQHRQLVHDARVLRVVSAD